MSDERTHPLQAAEVIAAGSAALPPNPPTAPLGTTAEDVGDIKVRSIEEYPPASNLDTKDEEKLVSGQGGLDTTPTLEQSSPPTLSTYRLIGIATVATCSMALSSAGNTALNIALPAIQKDLNMRETDLQWISSAYSLTFGCFLLLSGRLADVHGRKLVYLVGISWFALWTTIGPFIRNGAGLAVSRALAGCGASMGTPSAIGIIASTFHGRNRATAFAAFAAGAPVGGGIGLAIGGLLTTYAPTTWRACLWVMAGLAVGTSMIAYLVFPADVYTTADRRVDWVGAALVTVGLVFLQFSISGGQSAPQGWKTGYIIALLILGALLVAAFFFWERHVINNTSRPPLMRLKLWTRSRGRLAAVYMIGFISWMGFVSLAYFSTLFYQQVQLLSPIQAMVRFLPMTVSGVICNIIVAKFIARVPTQILVCIGVLATGVANVLFAISPASVSYWRYPFNAMWLCVLGADFLMATGTLFISKLALPEEQSVAGALFQTLVQLGGSFGLALTSVISSIYHDKGTAEGLDPIDALLKGIHAAFWLASACSFLALVVAVGALRGMGTIGKGPKEEGLAERVERVGHPESGEAAELAEVGAGAVGGSGGNGKGRL